MDDTFDTIPRLAGFAWWHGYFDAMHAAIPRNRSEDDNITALASMYHVNLAEQQGD